MAYWPPLFGWPAYQPDVSLFAVVIALLMSAVWIWAVTRKRLQGRQAITNWATGVTLVWTLAATLWLPWLDTQKRYREVVADMMSVLPNTVLQGAQCVVADDNNLGVFALWQYYAALRLRDLHSDAGQRCAYQLVVANERIYRIPGGKPCGVAQGQVSTTSGFICYSVVARCSLGYRRDSLLCSVEHKQDYLQCL